MDKFKYSTLKQRPKTSVCVTRLTSDQVRKANREFKNGNERFDEIDRKLARSVRKVINM